MKDTLKIGSLGNHVRYLQGLLLAAGVTLAADGVFGAETDAAVRAFQLWRKLRVDGVVGRLTWQSLEAAVNQHETMPEKPVKDGGHLWAAGVEAIETALRWWKDDIYDPKRSDTSIEAEYSASIIDTFIRNGLGWGWEPPYEGDGDFEWCGAFAATCWAAVKPELRKAYFSSTYRLDRYAKYRSAFGEKNEGSGRLVLDLDENTNVREFPSKWQVMPGDILLVGRAGYGSHICLVESYDAEGGVFSTVEGNGVGKGPNGERQHGVVRAKRILAAEYGARRIIRPSAEDLA